MLDQAIQQQPSIGEIHIAARQRLVDRHMSLMAEIMKENSHKDKYWILGMAECKRKNGKTRITPFMKAYDVQPEVRKEAYLYEVDNTKGTRVLVWVMHPNNKLAIPTLGKTISVAG